MVIKSYSSQFPRIGTLRESSLHMALKEWYSEPGDKLEVPLDGYIIDILRGNLLIEIQTKNFSAIKKKLENLIKSHKVRLVYPISQDKWIVCQDRTGTNVIRRRLSPKHGSYENLFEELIRIPEFVSNINFSLEVLLIEEEEIRRNDGMGSWKRKGLSIIDHKLLKVREKRSFCNRIDYLSFLPKKLKYPFTNSDLANALQNPLQIVQKMTYCLRKMRVLQVIGKKGRSYLYDIKIDKVK